MQSKGAVKLFAILLALVCIYQLSFTLVTRGIESDAKEFAKGDEQKEKSSRFLLDLSDVTLEF